MILKLAFLSCVLYMAVAILMELALFLVARFSGGSGLFANRAGWFVLFGLIWLGSFGLSYHLVVSGLHAKLHH
jgi:hypothetical protein